MPTITDVAAKAGVSVSTVSYVISGARPISEQTQKRVRAAIVELKFTPHAGARSIRTRRTGIIALVIPMNRGSYAEGQMPFIAAALAEAQEYDLNVLVLTADDAIRRVSVMTQSAMIDGVIVMEIERHDPRIVELSMLGKPVVLMGTPIAARGIPTVDFDFRRAGEVLAAELARLGHRRLLYVGQAPDVFNRDAAFAVSARAGFSDAARRAGADVVSAATDAVPEHVEAVVNDALDGADPVTGICVFNEDALPQVVAALVSRGVVVPDLLTVVALCPQALATKQALPIGFVDLPAAELARLSIRRVAAAIEGRDGEDHRVLEPTLTTPWSR